MSEELDATIAALKNVCVPCLVCKQPYFPHTGRACLNMVKFGRVDYFAECCSLQCLMTELHRKIHADGGV